MTNSVLRQIVESIARRLTESAFFRTVPKIRVVVEDSKSVMEEIQRASDKSSGCFALVSFASAETDNESPGPYLTTCNFRVQVFEFPQTWRSKPGSVPSCTETAEAVARLLHHYSPTDTDGTTKLANGVLRFDSMEQSNDDSALIQTISFNLPLVLSPSDPTR